MILKKLTSLASIAIFVECLSYAAVVAQEDSCNCTCLETSKIVKKETPVCNLLSQLKDEVGYVNNVVTEREKYTAQFDDMLKTLQSHKVLIEKLKPKFESPTVPFGPLNNPEPSNLITDKGLQGDHNETQIEIKNLEDKLNSVTSILEKLDLEEAIHSKLATLKETFFQNHLSELSNKLEGVVYKKDTKTIEERLDSMEAKLSNLMDSKPILQMSKDIHSFQSDLERMNATIQEGVQSVKERKSLTKTHLNKLKKLKNLKSEVESSLRSFANSQNELKELRVYIKDVEYKNKNTEDELVNLAIRTSVNDRQWTSDQLVKFKTEWILNCSSEISQCFSHQSNQTPLKPTPKNSLRRWKNLYKQAKSFYGCAPILSGNFPSLQITHRDEDNTLTFSCVKNATLIGNNSTQCQNGTWVPDTPPICIEKSTDANVPDWPRIETDI